jgi:glycosyltransferase involved in cell wall biosynthesis
MKKVIFILGTRKASGYYRMEMACNLLQEKGFQAESVYYDTLEYLNLTAEIPTILGKPKLINLLDYDVIIFQLVWHPFFLHFMDRLKTYNKKLVMEIDDDYFAIPASNPAWITFHPKIKVKQDANGERVGIKYKTQVNTKLITLRNACRKVDMLQVSTPELAEIYKPLNKNIVILENMIENELYDAIPKRQNKKPVIGWYGTGTHEDDLRIVLGCFPQQEKFTLLLAGWGEVSDVLFKGYKNLEVYGRFPMEDLPKYVKKCDIGIVPLVGCRFNDGKSDLKGMEFGAGEIPVIASDVAPYRRWIRHNENGLLVKRNKTKFWIRYLKQLIEDKDLRERLGKEAKKDAIKRDISNNIDKWINTYFL